MLFNSFLFLYFFLAVFALRWALPQRFVGPFLLAASYAFYLSWGLKYGALILGMTLFTYVAAGRIKSAPDPAAKKRRLLGTVVLLLLPLVFFKYTDFLLGTVGAKTRLELALPLGISFFTFEMLSYVIDLYRGGPEAKSVTEFFLYIAYFPHLVAGPIVRADELLPELGREHTFDSEKVSEGAFVALFGLAKKVVIADNLGAFANAVFREPDKQTGPYLWLGVLAYTGQIFCDFSGYTDIARGGSLMLGYELPENFDYPYASANIAEFWRRWHMTLSRWLRDYLYISLGGNRGGALRTYRNLFLTMLLGGLWHGPRWTFVVWGGYHGALLALHKLYADRAAKVPALARVRKSVPYRALAVAVTFLQVVVGWVFFRAETFEKAWTVLGGMARARGPLPAYATLPDDVKLTLTLLGVLAVIHVFGVYKAGLRAHRRLPAPARGLVWAALAYVCFFFATSSPLFIYFNF